MSIAEFTGFLRGTDTNNATAGIMEITGADSSKETLTVLNSVDVQLEIDENGDDIVDETILTTWDELFTL